LGSGAGGFGVRVGVWEGCCGVGVMERVGIGDSSLMS
jgi:hypothetical protein